MTTEGTYGIKAGDDEPVLEAILLDASGLPADLTGCTNLLATIRPQGGGEILLQRSFTIVDIAAQALSDPTRGQVRIVWANSETAELWDPAKACQVQTVEVQFHATRSGKLVTWPTRSGTPIEIWLRVLEPVS